LHAIGIGHAQTDHFQESYKRPAAKLILLLRQEWM